MYVCKYFYKECIYIYVHSTNNPVLQSDTLGAYIHRAGNAWES